MARTIRQDLPAPPPVYDQAYIAQLADAINRYMIQREAQGELITARLVLTATPRIPTDLPDTSTLPTGAVYLAQDPSGNPSDPYFLTVVTQEDK